MAATHPEITTSVHPATLVEDDLVTSSAGRKVLAATRLATGFIFLWAFLDKTFGPVWASCVRRNVNFTRSTQT